MVKGLNLFKNAFKNHSDKYILIGGTACDLALQKKGELFRATKDLDVVLCIEVLDADFVSAFWDFIRAGQYEIQQKSSGQKQFYRFKKPKNPEYPVMIELFSRKPDLLDLNHNSHLTPIPTDEDLSSLSAILMDNEYYQFILSSRDDLDGIPFVGLEYIVPLKARAWLDLVARQSKGEKVQSSTIKKHKNDIFRLYQVIDPETKLDIPPAIKSDLFAFINAVKNEDINLKQLGLVGQSLDEVLQNIKVYYCL